MIRRSTPADAPRCVQVAHDAHVSVAFSMAEIYGDELFERLHPNRAGAQAAQIEAWLNDTDKITWVAELDERAVGCVVTSHDARTGMGMIDLIAVDPTLQRRGVGRQLMAHALDHLAHAGVEYVEAYLRDFPGHAPAQRLLASLGFGRRPVMPVLLARTVEHPGKPASRPSAIRRIAEVDIDRCVGFGVDAFHTVYASFEECYGPDRFARIEPDWEVSQAEFIRSAITEDDDETWVFDVDGRPAGFIVLKMDDHGIADIDLLAVDPSVQGIGVATALNRFAFDRSQEASMACVVVATADDPGHAAARRSYERAGFTQMPIQWNLQIIHL